MQRMTLSRRSLAAPSPRGLLVCDFPGLPGVPDLSSCPANTEPSAFAAADPPHSGGMSKSMGKLDVLADIDPEGGDEPSECHGGDVTLSTDKRGKAWGGVAPRRSISQRHQGPKLIASLLGTRLPLDACLSLGGMICYEKRSSRNKA